MEDIRRRSPSPRSGDDIEDVIKTDRGSMSNLRSPPRGFRSSTNSQKKKPGQQERHSIHITSKLSAASAGLKPINEFQNLAS